MERLFRRYQTFQTESKALEVTFKGQLDYLLNEGLGYHAGFFQLFNEHFAAQTKTSLLRPVLQKFEQQQRQHADEGMCTLIWKSVQ